MPKGRGSKRRNRGRADPRGNPDRAREFFMDCEVCGEVLTVPAPNPIVAMEGAARSGWVYDGEGWLCWEHQEGHNAA